tara:strand:+ start:574 stop:768 length:195 start_codon:yes stop_codon:yes gene_type:complete
MEITHLFMVEDGRAYEGCPYSHTNLWRWWWRRWWDCLLLEGEWEWEWEWEREEKLTKRNTKIKK